MLHWQTILHRFAWFCCDPEQAQQAVTRFAVHRSVACVMRWGTQKERRGDSEIRGAMRGEKRKARRTTMRGGRRGEQARAAPLWFRFPPRWEKRAKQTCEGAALSCLSLDCSQDAKTEGCQRSPWSKNACPSVQEGRREEGRKEEEKESEEVRRVRRARWRRRTRRGEYHCWRSREQLHGESVCVAQTYFFLTNVIQSLYFVVVQLEHNKGS